MRHVTMSNQLPGIGIGILFGVLIAYILPHEPLYATTGDRAGDFTVLTVPTRNGPANGSPDAVVVVDFASGQLKGGMLNTLNGRFESFFFRDLAKDFDVDLDGPVQFRVTAGYANVADQGGAPMHFGVVYVAERSSGKLAAYSLPQTVNPGPKSLFPMDVLTWTKRAE